jgi:hypothetical protein
MPENPLADLCRSYPKRNLTDLERICATPRAVLGSWAAFLVVVATAAAMIGIAHGLLLHPGLFARL